MTRLLNTPIIGPSTRSSTPRGSTCSQGCRPSAFSECPRAFGQTRFGISKARSATRQPPPTSKAFSSWASTIGRAWVLAARRPRIIVAWRLLVEPDVLEARAVIDAVDHRCQALDVWFAAVCGAGVKEDRAGVVLDQ